MLASPLLLFEWNDLNSWEHTARGYKLPMTEKIQRISEGSFDCSSLLKLQRGHKASNAAHYLQRFVDEFQVLLSGVTEP